MFLCYLTMIKETVWGEMMKKSTFIILLFVFLLTTPLFGVFRTSEAGRYYYWLFSPDLLSRGVGYAGTDNPSGMIINPAGNAFAQRIKIEASYGVTPAFWTSSPESFLDGGDFFLPFIINSGAIIPSKYGNFTVYANYMNMSNLGFGSGHNNDLAIGKLGTLYFGFSKDYNDNFSFGFSGNLKFSYNPESRYDELKFDVAGGFDFGFIFRPEWRVPFNKTKKSNWALQDFEFAVMVKDFGKPLLNLYNGNYLGDDFSVLGVLTPAASLSFNFYNDGATYWKFIGDVTSPFFQNFTTSVGMEVQIYKFLILRAAYTFDLEGILELSGAIPQYEYMYNPANVSFGMSFRFRSDFFKKQTKEEEYKNRHKTTEFSIDLGARPFSSGFMIEAGFAMTIGTKDVTPPDITYIQKETYASPNFDGIQDEIPIELDIKDDRYIMMWKLEIYDNTGKIVRTIANKEERKETVKFQDVVKRYFSPKKGIPIPKQVIWDGRDDKGNVVADGKYSFKFYAMDDNKNINKEGTAAGNIVIKTDKPLIESQVQNLIFSPNNDGSKDTFILDIDIIKSKIESITEEKSDIIEIKKESINTSIKSELNMKELSQTINQKVDDKKEEKKEEKKQVWVVEILDSSDKIVKSYTFDNPGKQKLEWDGNDEKGNKMADGVYKVKLHSVDLAGNYWEKFINNIIINTEPTPIEAVVSAKIFSPNNDTVKDSIAFKFNIPNKKGIIKWNYDIVTKDNKVVKSFSGEGLPPNDMLWNGKDENGNYAKEGDYKGKLSLTYENGNMPFGETPYFTVDVTPPDGDLKLSREIFSPNGDGKTDDVNIALNTSDEEEWNGTIFDETGKRVKSYIWKGKPPKQFVWDGKDNENKLLADGKYFMQISSTDTAGNYFETPKVLVNIFTEDTPVFITASLDAFNPGGVKNKQTFEIKAKLAKDNRVLSYEVAVKDDKDNSVYTLKREGDLPKVIEWDGKNNEGKICEDGYYTATLKVNFSATDADSVTKPFIIDSVFPSIDLASVSPVFSPNKDGNLDIFEILQKGSEETQWQAKIVDNKDTVLWETFYAGRPKQKELWDGIDLNGNLMKNDLYKYVISSTDEAGNTTIKDIPIELKNIYTVAYVTLDDDKFSPNKDSKFDLIKFRPFVNVKEDLEVYKIEVLDKDKKVVKTFSGTKTIPEIIEWDGITDKNSVAKDGFYTLKLSTIYRFGNRPQVESAQFILDTTPPEMSLAFEPQYFSPDSDGVDDELSISVKSYDLSGIKDWNINVLTPDKNKNFYAISGTGKPTEKFVWEGKGLTGDIVESAEDYPVKIYAVDNVGNVLEKEIEPVMVDILVIKLDDGRLKIKISNIEFEPDSAKMTNSPKNEKILGLLVKALKKYSQYRILIEGHANKFKEGLNEKIAKDLSDERAKFILSILTKKGIAAARMSALGRGFDVPLVPLSESVTAEELAKNRRVEFYLDKNQ